MLVEIVDFNKNGKRFGTHMKKKVCLLFVYFAIFCTAILGGCSCSKDPNGSTSSVTAPTALTITNKNNVDNCYVVDGNTFAYVSSTIKLDYAITPITSTNNDVNVYLTGTTSAASVVSTVSNGVTGSVILTTLDKGVVTLTIETKSSPVRADHFTFEVVAPTALSTPSALHYEGGALVWNRVVDAKSYSLVILEDGVERQPVEITPSVNGGSVVSYQVPSSTILTGHEYTAKVKANGNGTTTADSVYSDTCYFTILDRVTNISQDKGVLSFPAVPRATEYELEIEYTVGGVRKTDKVTTNHSGSNDVTYFLKDNYPNATQFTVSVRALHSSTDTRYVYLTGEWSDALTIVQLDKVSGFRVDNSEHASVIRWNEVEYATGYTVMVMTTSGQIITTKSVESSAYVVDESLVSGTYQIMVGAHGEDNAIDGELSDTFAFSKLASVNMASVRLTGNILSFTSIAGVEQYEITYENDDYIFTDKITGNRSVVGDCIKEPGTYHIGIRAIAKSDTGLNLVNSNKISLTSLIVEKLPNASIHSISNHGTKSSSIDHEQGVQEYITGWTLPTLTWQQVPHATSYTVYYAKNGQSPITAGVVTDRLTYEFGELEAGSYTAWVQANGTGNVISSTVAFEENSKDGFAFTVLDNIDYASIRWDDDNQQIRFGRVAKASGYIVQENDSTMSAYLGNDTTYTPRQAREGSNTLTLYAWGNGVDSVVSRGARYTFEKLYTPTAISVSAGNLVIEPHSANANLNDAVYEIEISVAGVVTGNVTTSDLVVDLAKELAPHTTYTLRVRATKAGKLHSEYTSSIDVQVLAMSSVTVRQSGDQIEASWERVIGASAYEVVISLGDSVIEESRVTGTSYLTTSVAQAGKYTISVRAIGGSEESILAHLSSYNTETGVFYRLVRPQVSVSNGQLSWTSGDLNVDGVKAQSYLVTFSNGDSVTVTDALSYVAPIPAGTYTATVQALGDNATIMSSLTSASFEFTKLNQASLTLANGELTIVDTNVTSGVAGTKYNLYNAVTTGGNTTYTLVKENITSTTQDLGQYLTQGMTYHLVVQVSHNDYMMSTLECDSYKEVERLSASTAFVIENGTFHWQGVTHATGYTILATKGMTYEETVGVSVTQNPMPVLPNSGAYTFGLVAVGDNTKYVSSRLTTVDTYALPTITNLRVENGVLAYNYTDKKTPVRFELTITNDDGSFVVDNQKQLTFAMRDTNEREYRGTYTVTVTAVGDGSSTITSAVSDSCQVTKLDMPTDCRVSVTSYLDGLIRGMLQWKKPIGASSTLQYALLLNGKETTLVQAKGINDYETGDRVGYFFFEKDGYYYLTSENLLTSGAQNHISIRSFDHSSVGYIDSENTPDAVVMGMNAPTNVQVTLDDMTNQATLTWDSVAGATKYAIYEVLESDQAGTSMLSLRTDLGENGRVTTNSCKILNTDTDSNSYALVVLAISASDQVLGQNNVYWTSGVSSVVRYHTLGPVTGLKVEEGVLTWNTGLASKFDIDIFEYSDGIEQNFEVMPVLKTIPNYTDTVYALDELEGGKQYFIAVYPVGNSTSTISNGRASTITLTKMPGLQNVRVIDGVLTWDMPYDTINTLMNYRTISGTSKVFDSTEASKVAELVDKRNNGQLSPEESAYLRSIMQLVTFEMGVAKVGSNLSSVGQYVYDTLYVTGVEPASDHMIMTYDDMLYDDQTSMLSEAGYYQIKLRTLGNSGEESDGYTLFASASYPAKTTTVYRSPIVEQVEMGSASTYRKSYIHSETITFVKVPNVINNNGVITTQDVEYIVEFEFVGSNGMRQFQSIILSSSKIGDKQNGEISIQQLIEENDLKLSAGTVYFVRVRTRGTANSTLLDDNQTLILRSGVGSSSRMQVLSLSALGISSGELYWSKGASSNALSYELEGYALTSSTDVVDESATPVLSRVYDAKVASYEDLDQDFADSGLGHGWYAFRVRAVGNGSEYLTGAWSDYLTVYRLPNIVASGNEIYLSSGDIAWTPSYNDDNVTSSTASKVLVYSSNSKNGAYRTDMSDYTIVSGTKGQLSSIVLADKYAKALNNITQYYKVAVANIVTDDKQPDTGYLYLRSDYTLMSEGYSRLDEPTGLRISGGKVVWDATGTQFEVMINGEALGNQVVTAQTSGTSFSLDLDTRFLAGKYSIRVRNLADSIMRALSSTYSEELIVTKYKAPDLRLEKGHIVWNTSGITNEEDTNIGSIEVAILVGTQEVWSATYDHKATSINLNEIVLSNGEHLPGSVEYTIKVGYKVGENNTVYVDGEIASMNFTILPSVVLRADSKSNSESIDNYIVWDALSNAKGYVASIYYRNADGTFSYAYSEEVSLDNRNNSDNFDFDEATGTMRYKVPRIEGKLYRVYMEAIGDTIDTAHRGTNGLFASSLIVGEQSYMDIELPTCPEVDVQRSNDGYITWKNVTESAYPVVEYEYKKTATYEWSDTVIVQLPKDRTYYYLPTVAGEYTVKVYARNDLGANSNAVTFKTSFTSYDDGDGTVDNPYQISNGTQFSAMRKRGMLTDWGEVGGRVHFVLTKDIVLNNNYVAIDNFYAKLVGQNTEQGTKPSITLPTGYKGTLFGEIAQGASVENIRLTHTLTLSQDTYSLLAGSNEGLISQVDIILNGRYTTSHFASVVLTNTGVIQDTTVTLNSVNVLPYSNGGELYVSLVTEENNGTVDGVTLSGSVTVSASTQGEVILAGVAYRSRGVVRYVTNYASMNVSTASRDNSSTLVGLVYNNRGLIEYCGVESTLVGNAMGGLVFNNYATIDNSYFVGNMQATRVSGEMMPLSVGGLVVNNQNVAYEVTGEIITTTPILTNCYVVMKNGITIHSNVSGLSDGYAHIGGLVVNNNINATHVDASIANCYVAIHGIKADISGYHYGVIAYSSTAKVNNYPLFSNVYYYNVAGENTLIRLYNGSEHITTSNNTLGFVPVTNYASLDQLSGLRTSYKVSDTKDYVVLGWQEA